MIVDDATSLLPSVALSAGSDLLLHTRASGHIAVSGSGSWSATGDVLLGSGALVSGSGSTLAIGSDSDGSGIGSLTFASTSNITMVSSTVSQISFKYSDVQWSSGFILSASNADVIFDKSVPSTASFGGTGKVSSAELEMVTTTGILQLGSSLATDISLKGMDRKSYSESLVLVKSAGFIIFDTGDTIIANALDARARGRIVPSAVVTCSRITLRYFDRSYGEVPDPRTQTVVVDNKWTWNIKQNNIPK